MLVESKSPLVIAFVATCLTLSALPLRAALADDPPASNEAANEPVDPLFRYKAVPLTLGATGMLGGRPLSDALAHAGYSRLPPIMGAVGAGIMAGTHDGFVVGLDYRFYGASYPDVDFAGHQFLLDVGALLWATSGVVVYPTFGAGLGLTRLHVSRPAEFAPTFAASLAAPAGEATFQQLDLVLQTGLAVDFFAFHGLGPFIGLRVGGTYAPIGSGWRRGDSDVAGLPRASATTLGASIAIGFGAVSRPKY